MDKISENQNKIGKESGPDKKPQTALLEPTPGPESRSANTGNQSQTVFPADNSKMIDLAELKENERCFRTIFESAPIGIAIASPQGYFLQVNESFSRMLGYDHSEITQLTFLDITHPEDRPQTSEFSRKVADGLINSYTAEKRYLKKDGQSIWGIVRATAVRDRNKAVKYWLGLVEDISERKKAEQTIRESEEKYRNILEEIEEGYFEADLKGNLTFCNGAMCKILGYSADELRVKNHRNYTSRKTARKIFRIFRQVYRTGRSARILNYEVFTKDGTKKILYLSASLKRDTDRKIIGFRGIVQDVTDQLIAEKQREQLVTQMLHAQKMEAIGTLAGGIAHDFNNLLMGFQGNLSLMLMDVDAAVTDAIKKICQAVLTIWRQRAEIKDQLLQKADPSRRNRSIF